MPLQQVRNCNFGRLKANATGSSGVGYTLLDPAGAVASPRTTAGVQQSAPGIYAAYVTFPDDFRGQLLWDTGAAFSAVYYAVEQYNVEENDPRTSQVLDVVTQVSSSSAIAASSATQAAINAYATFNTLTQVSGTVDSIYDIVSTLSSSVGVLTEDLPASVAAATAAASSISNSAVALAGSVTLLSGTVTDLSGITTSLTDIDSKIDKLIDIQYGRWHVIGDEMVFYKADNVTEVARFKLLDDVGNPTMDAVFERIRL